MSIAPYIRDIGRGRDGARALTRAQAADLMAQVLDGVVTDLEVGAFCLAMRIKGETPEEMAGFLDAAQARLPRIEADAPLVVLPSYNGARRLPVLTPLLAALLAREGLAVLVHGTATEDKRVTSEDVWRVLGWPVLDGVGSHETMLAAASRVVPDAALGATSVAALDTATGSASDAEPVAAHGTAPSARAPTLRAGEVVFAPTARLCPGLKRLLDVRRTVGLRNPAHSLVKLMCPPTQASALVIGSYTHPEYALSMAATFALTGTRALLLRGTEGEPVADARRQPQIEAFVHGARHTLVEAQSGSLAQLPELPTQIDATGTADYIRAVLAGERPTPAPIAAQVRAALQALTL